MEEMYRLFVTNNQEPDIVGLIAYSLYKREKIDYIDNRKPAKDELRAFVQASGLPMQIARYKEDAQKVLASTIDNVMDNSLKSIEINPLGENFFSESSIQGFLNDKLPSKSRNVWWNIQGTFWFYVILAAVLFLIQVIFNDKYQSIGQMLRMWFT